MITPFRIEIGDAQLEDLRDRLARTRWPEAETVDDWSQGIPLAYVQELAATDKLNVPAVRTVGEFLRGLRDNPALIFAPPPSEARPEG